MKQLWHAILWIQIMQKATTSVVKFAAPLFPKPHLFLQDMHWTNYKLKILFPYRIGCQIWHARHLFKSYVVSKISKELTFIGFLIYLILIFGARLTHTEKGCRRNRKFGFQAAKEEINLMLRVWDFEQQTKPKITRSM